MDGREPLIIERVMAGETVGSIPIFPHCDGRILHVPAECRYCAMSTELQEERERLGVSNTGCSNRAHPCPADVARGSDCYDAWPGNRRAP